MKKRNHNYSEVKRKLKIDIGKDLDNGVAFITHYFQNHGAKSADYYKKGAQEFLDELNDGLVVN